MHVYFFSGLGADERVFSKLNLDGIDHTFIRWPEPLKSESMESYVSRISEEIKDPEPVLAGLSFGGLVAQEMAAYLGRGRVLLISSMRTRDEIPWYFRWLGKLGVHRLIPGFFFSNSGWWLYALFGAKTKVEKMMLDTFVRNTSEAQFRWALNVLLGWKREKPLNGVSQVHGDADRILPRRYIREAETISGGGHFMVLLKPREMNSWLHREVGIHSNK